MRREGYEFSVSRPHVITHLGVGGALDNTLLTVERLPRERQTLMFSATMPGEIRRLADELLDAPCVVELRGRGGVAAVVEELKKLSKPTKDKKEIAQIGTISANNDPMVGNLISEAMEKVGKEGVITVEEAKSMETTLEIVEGMQFDRGYLSPYFVTDAEKMETALEEPYVLINEKKITVMKDLVPLLESISKAGKPLLIIAEDVDAEALTLLVVNKLRSVLNVCAVKAPGFGDRRKAMLEDIAILTGGRAISEDLGLELRVGGNQAGCHDGGARKNMRREGTACVPTRRRRR